jgi:Domain of unknown function (DUF303).
MIENELKLAPIFSDNMVLQQNQNIVIWGKGNDGYEVSASICGTSAYAKIINGKWKITIPPLPAMDVCELLVESGGQKITIKNVAIGEVWIAGGQSNMEMPLRLDAQAAQSIASSFDPDFRYYEVPPISYEGQEKDEDFSEVGLWKQCAPDTAGRFSAVSFYFGCMIRKKLNVPVGIIVCNVGGTSASCWLTEEDLHTDVDLDESYLKTYTKGLCKLNVEKYKKRYKIMRKKGRSPQLQKMIDNASIGKYSLAQLIILMWLHGISFRTFLAGQVVGPLSPNRPAALYHTMVETIIPYTVQGVIWYQGEADYNYADYYARLFTKVINRWRSAWGAELPFVFVQLAPFGHWFVANGKNYPVLRAQQEIVSKTVEKAYMASIMDCGEKNSIHPQKKKPVGERLALLALGKVYGEPILCDPPELESVQYSQNKLVLTYRNAGDGLVVSGGKINGLQIFDAQGKEIKRFETTVNKDKLYIKSQEQIAEIRFAWMDYVEANLYSSAGLCVKPFCIDIK